MQISGSFVSFLKTLLFQDLMNTVVFCILTVGSDVLLIMTVFIFSASYLTGLDDLLVGMKY